MPNLGFVIQKQIFANMMKYIMIFLSILMTQVMFSQEIDIFNQRLNIVFLGIDNSIQVCNLSDSESYYLKASNGDLTKVDDFNYKLNIKKPGNTYLTLFKISNQDTVEVFKKEFRIKHFPCVTAEISGKTGGEIDKGFLLSSIGLSAPLINWDIEIDFPILSYKVLIIQNEQVLFNKAYQERRFPTDLLREFERLSTGDMIFFYDIEIQDLSNYNRKISSINFIIK